MRGRGRAAEAAAGGLRDQAGGPDAEPVSDQRRHARPLQPRAGRMNAPASRRCSWRRRPRRRVRRRLLWPGSKVRRTPSRRQPGWALERQGARSSPGLVAMCCLARQHAHLPSDGPHAATAVLQRVSAVGGAELRAWRARESCCKLAGPRRRRGRAAEHGAGSSRPWAGVHGANAAVCAVAATCPGPSVTRARGWPAEGHGCRKGGRMSVTYASRRGHHIHDARAVSGSVTVQRKPFR